MSFVGYFHKLTFGGLYSQEYKVRGRRDSLEEPKLEFRVHLMDLSSDDKNKMQLNHSHIPDPAVGDQRSHVFYLPIGLRIVYVSDFVRVLVLHLNILAF